MSFKEPISFGRNEILSRILKRVNSLEEGYRQNIGLIGVEGMGKSHLLSLVLHSLAGREDILTISINANALNLEQLVDHWCANVLASPIFNKQLPIPENFQDLAAEALHRIPKTAERVYHIKKTLRRGEKGHHLIRELFSLTGILSEETKKKVILVIEEFHELGQLPVSDPFALFGKEIMVQKETLFLVSSSKPETASDIFRDKLSLLFGNFEVLELLPLTYEEIERYVQEKQQGFAFSDLQKHFLLQMTDGIPVYLDLILDQLGFCFPVAHSSLPASEIIPVEIPQERFLQAFEKELLEDRGRISLLFQKRLQACRRFAKDSGAYIHALMAISSGKRKLASIAAFMERRVTETKKILERLTEEEMISKNGGFYMIDDSQFRFWLLEVFYKKQTAYGPIERIFREAFSTRLQKILEEVRYEISQNDFTERLERLLKEFRNDKILLDHQNWRFPQFSEVVSKPSNGRFSTLMARGASVRWIARLFTASIQEEDVLAFLDELKRYRKRVEGRLMVALGGIDQNAKLLAQEAKVQILDLRNVNALLDLYHLPKIILRRDSHGSNLGTLEKNLHTIPAS